MSCKRGKYTSDIKRTQRKGETGMKNYDEKNVNKETQRTKQEEI